MSRRVLLPLVVLVPGGLFLFGPLSASGAPQGIPAKISKIRARFSEPKRKTTYSVRVLGHPRPKVSYHWRLSLTRVDSAVARDPGCNNHGVRRGSERKFVWRHGNKGDSVRDDGCDHAKMGKYGHQGLITVKVVSEQWKCRATYKGTNSSRDNKVAGLKAASKPRCVARS